MKVSSGVFPPADSAPKSSFGVPESHTPMNHDNSQLYYAGESQIKFHSFGLYPATDSASAIKHHLYAYNTACAAAIEWIKLLEEDPDVKAAIDFAKEWDMKKVDRDLADDLEDGLSSAQMVSCVLQKWDGNYPPKERDKDCNTFKLLGHIHIPKMSNKFWGSFPKIASSKSNVRLRRFDWALRFSIPLGRAASDEEGLEFSFFSVPSVVKKRINHPPRYSSNNNY